MTRNERLNILVERFREDSVEYRNLRVGDDPDEKRTVLRSLMNIRMPRSMDADTLRIRDEYLREAAREALKMAIPSELIVIADRYASFDIVSSKAGIEEHKDHETG